VPEFPCQHPVSYGIQVQDNETLFFQLVRCSRRPPVESPQSLASPSRPFRESGNKITQNMIFLIGNESVSPKKLSPRKINELQISNREEFSFFSSRIFRPLPFFVSSAMPKRTARRVRLAWKLLNCGGTVGVRKSSNLNSCGQAVAMGGKR